MLQKNTQKFSIMKLLRILEFGQDDVEESELVIEVKHISGNIYEIKFTGGVDESGNPVSGYQRAYALSVRCVKK